MRPDRLAVAALALLAACTGLRSEPLDAAVAPDAGRPDGGSRDADGGGDVTIDAGAGDGGDVRDGGPPRLDAGPCLTMGRVMVAETTFAMLATHDPGCSPTATDVLSCMRASRLFCLGRSCAATGMGALRNAPDTRVACLGGGIVETADSYDQLSMHGVVFDETSAAVRSGQVAVHRYCLARGYGVGIGPVDVDPVGRTARFACVPRGSSADVPVPLATSIARGCNPSDNPDSLTCTALAHDVCVASGWEAGIGPVDWDASSAHFACVGDL